MTLHSREKRSDSPRNTKCEEITRGSGVGKGNQLSEAGPRRRQRRRQRIGRRSWTGTADVCGVLVFGISSVMQSLSFAMFVVVLIIVECFCACGLFLQSVERLKIRSKEKPYLTLGEVCL